MRGKQAGGVSDPYWADEGARLAEAIVAFVLLVCRRRANIFGTVHRGSVIAGMGDIDAWAAIVHFAVRAEVVRGDPEIDELAEKCRRHAAYGMVAKDEFVREIELLGLYGASGGFRADLDRLLRQPEMSMVDRVRATQEKLIAATIRDLALAVSLIAARSVENPPAAGPNLLCLAGEALQALFAGRPNHKYTNARFPAAAVAIHLGRDTRFKSGEVGALLESIRQWWNPLAEAERQYYGVVGMARTVFPAFSDVVPSRAIRFGCEPGDRSTIDFAEAVDGTGDRRRVFVYRVGLDRQHELVAKVVKASFFEAVLNNPRRRADGSDMPLACYVADEFHRFVTGGVAHGERSYVDTCRSHGACCIFATQSVSSLRFGLALITNPQ